MGFAEPQYLPLIPLSILAMLAFSLYTGRRKRKMLKRFCEPGLWGKIVPHNFGKRDRAGAFLMSLALALILFSIARPQYGTMESPHRRRGVEITIAMDCSRSMLGDDIKPNRLARARQQLRGLIQRLQGNNIAIIAYAGMAFVQCPMTSDYEMALNLMDALEPDAVPIQGTSISAAIRKSFDVFQTAGKGYRVLILLTDGEDHEGEVMAAAEEAAGRGIRIFAIGIGTIKGSPIPVDEGHFLESKGMKVNTRLNLELLRQVALKTGGKAILANPAGDLELREIAHDINELKKADLQTTASIQYIERFQPFLALGIFLLFIQIVLTNKRQIHTEGRKPPSGNQITGAKYQ